MAIEIAPSTFTKFFNKTKFDLDFSRISLFVLRKDGVVVHSISDKTRGDISSIGALLGGVWQAAEALSNFIPNKSGDIEFRLGFDSTSDGVYILPIHIFDTVYYLGTIYHGAHNPGHLKSKIRSIGFKLELFLESNAEVKNEPSKQFLFDDISNDEMDRLFAFAEN